MSDSRHNQSARGVFLKWEKLRVLYNSALAAEVLVLLGSSGELSLLITPSFLVYLGFRAVVANVCFTAGPVAEAYVRWLGVRLRWVTHTLFIGGLLVSLILAASAIAYFDHPDVG